MRRLPPGFERGHDGLWAPYLVNGLFKLLVLAALIALAVWAVRQFSRGGQGRAPAAAVAAPPSAALEEVRMRYARGDITRDDFVRMSRDLGGPALPPEPAGDA